MGGFRGSLSSFSAPQVWKDSLLIEQRLLDIFTSLELWPYLQPLSVLVALKRLWMRSTWGPCYRF